MDNDVVDWDSMSDAADAINAWANRTFPGRKPKAALSKLTMAEIPELLVHLNEHGTDNIGEEWADCLILLLDLAVTWKVNPGEAIRRKMEINNHRMWRKDEDTGHFQHVVVKQVADQSGAEHGRTHEASRAPAPDHGEASPGTEGVAAPMEAGFICKDCNQDINKCRC